MTCRSIQEATPEDPLLLALPKKGRLQENALSLINAIDIRFHRKPRHDIALSTTLPVKLVFLPATDIAKFVGAGNVDMGITGQDMVSEAQVDVEEALSLGFGHCELCVQVPMDSGVQEPRDLLGKRIVTSFPNTVRRYFSQWDGAAKTSEPEDLEQGTRVMYVSGSVETACSLGLADGIVDLVESGDTMRAMGLRKVATVLRSEAVLIVNRRTRHPATVGTIVGRIRGNIHAQRYVFCSYNVPESLIPRVQKITPGCTAPTITALQQNGWFAVSAMVPKKESAHVMDKLAETGAKDIVLFAIQNSRVNEA